MEAGKHRGEYPGTAEEVGREIQVGPALLQGFEVTRLAELGDQEKGHRAQPGDGKGQ